ncbi:hypothetical protein [Saccharopolyspora spinosa]|uniref:hypothetical protein n=1 Tax=Saccharopolyspora spinosa TaxID=60894 RepID=UPI00147292FC|nr:hypothetical protein [Saccharopolyspora spinosa]
MPYQNLSFGTGACYCAGAALARLQAAVVIPSLLNGFPGWGCPWKPPARLATTASSSKIRANGW